MELLAQERRGYREALAVEIVDDRRGEEQGQQPLAFAHVASSRARSFSWIPSNPPLDMTTITSPRATCVITYEMISFTVGNVAALTPSRNKCVTTRLVSRRSFSGILDLW